MSKVIYSPKNAAGEYAKYAVNFYVGCRGEKSCSYCYCKKVLRGYWPDKPQLKKCFRDEKHALEVFEKELMANLPELQKHGLFFSFTTDPMLPETIFLTMMALCQALRYNVPVKVLTKNANFLSYRTFMAANLFDSDSDLKSMIAFGFTLTGHDEIESGASTNAERIEAMKKLHDAGFKTFASIEPVIDFESSMQMIIKTAGCCDLLKIGLESGKKYNLKDLLNFIATISFVTKDTRKVYFKDSLLEQAGIDRKDLPANCVTRDYNLFNN